MDANALSIFLAFLFTFLHSTVTAKDLYLNKLRSKEYDYIIVGAGSAGSVLASRLTEDPTNHVLLLEAGGLPNGMSEVPFFFPKVIGSELDWKYYTEPQKHACFGLKGQRTFMPRGKVLGGSSTINALIYIRGLHRDFDEWTKAGSTGWSWKEVLPYFKKSEDLRIRDNVDEEYHGKDGYLTVTSNPDSSELQEAYLEAVKHLGYNIVDVNGKDQLGFLVPPVNVRDGLRCSTEKSFLRPAAHRENLDILIKAHVTQVLLDDDNRAHSVKFEHDNASRVIRARKEIIVSAGAIGSPHLLMLSGIGPKEHLQELGISVKADLPVGQNLQDHMSTAGQVYQFNSSITLVPSEILNVENVGALQHGLGPLTVPVGMAITGFVNTKFQPESENWPDIQLFFPSTLFLPRNMEDVEEFRDDRLNKNLVNVFPMLCRPKSRGQIKLRSLDPYDHPLIDPQYFSVEDDLARLVEGMKFADTVMKSPPMQRYGATRVPKVLPGCEGIEPDSDQFFACLARRFTMTTFHQSGSCKMGSLNDATTVVDPELRVKGVKNLRVVDASIMPQVTSGNTNAPTIMIAEKAADMIRRRA